MGSAVGDAVKSGFNTAINGINTVIQKINSALSFTFPGWHIKLGGGKFLGKSLPSLTLGWDEKKFSLNLPTIPLLAKGTPNALNGLAIVGEKGPELVDFRGGERVYNNHNTEKMLAAGSKSNTFNVTFNNTSQTTAFTIMREFKKYNRELAFNGVL
jgi:phage-related tail protein